MVNPVEPANVCKDCKRVLENFVPCAELYHHFLGKEVSDPDFWQVHHLTVLTYSIQHPTFLTKNGRLEMQKMLKRFIVDGLSPQQARQQFRPFVSNQNRTWKITTENVDAPSPTTQWHMTIGQIRVDNSEHYCEDIRKWAWITLQQCMYDDAS